MAAFDLVISELPEPLGIVSIARYASPSLLSEAGSCIVRSFARRSNHSGHLDSLITGPFVEVGRAVHKALEVADGVQNIEEVFYGLIRSRESELQTDNRRSHYSNLEESVGKNKWDERLKIVKNHRGEKSAVELREAHSSIGSGSVQPANFQVPSEWVELFVANEELLLSGQIDRLELLDSGVIRIIDFKTGEILDDAGKPKRQYLLQLAAYEAICRGYWPHAQFELSLDNGVEIAVEIDEKIRNDFHSKLNSLRSSIGDLAGRQVDAANHESLSDGCLDCPIRHTCTAYQTVLKDDSLKDFVAQESLISISDGHGVVETIHKTPVETVVNIRTSSGRRVQLRSSFNWQVANLVQGHQISFFGFTPQRNRNKATGVESAPFGFSDSFRSSRNWNAEIFLT